MCLTVSIGILGATFENMLNVMYNRKSVVRDHKTFFLTTQVIVTR